MDGMKGIHVRPWSVGLYNPSASAIGGPKLRGESSHSVKLVELYVYPAHVE